MNRFELFLINPGRKNRFQWDMQEICELMGKKTTTVPLALPLIAALTPSHYKIRIIDEEIAPLPYKKYKKYRKTPDLVGITALLSNLQRAYEIADEFRAQKIPVVLGGPQVSFNVEEALEHADCVVVGEAEGAWEECLQDFERGSLKQVYETKERTSFRESPIPRWDLVDTSKIMTPVVQISRGCPNRCRFCVVSKMFGKEQRYRSVDNVIDEIRSLPLKEITFADDNLMADKDYARELVEKLIPLGVNWSCQSSIEVGTDPEMLDLMARSGCRSILFGFESLNQEALKEARKSSNILSTYEEVVDNVHRAGIHVIGSFLVGFEADTLDTFNEIYEFTQKVNLSFVMVNSLIPYPGTALYRQMEKAGRIPPFDYDEFVLFYPLMMYKNIAPDELCAHGLALLKKIYSYENLYKNSQEVLCNGAFVHDETEKIGVAEKVRSTFKLFQSHVLNKDPYKRRLFLDLFRLVPDKVVAPGDIVRYLLFMASQNGFLEYAEAHLPHALEHIRDRVDGRYIHAAKT